MTQVIFSGITIGWYFITKSILQEVKVDFIYIYMYIYIAYLCLFGITISVVIGGFTGYWHQRLTINNIEKILGIHRGFLKWGYPQIIHFKKVFHEINW